MSELEDIFHEIDPNNNGTIDFDKFAEYMEIPHRNSNDELKDAFRKLDKNGKGLVTH